MGTQQEIDTGRLDGLVELRSEPASSLGHSATIPSAGDVFSIVYPFVRDTYQQWDGDGMSDVPTWRPGVEHVWVSAEHTAPVADDIGQAVFTVIDSHKPGRFPTRVFFTRKFINPDGHEFGKGKLHITTLEKFRRLTRGYQHPFGVGKPLPSDHQWWRKPSDALREFEQMLAEYRAQAIETRRAETLGSVADESAGRRHRPTGVRMTDRITAEAGHTKGPWHIFASGLAASRNQVEINDPEGLSVAYVLKFVPEYVQQSNANARLIAAAPELLEALKNTTDDLQDMMDEERIADGDRAEVAVRVQFNRAAIARAQGTAS